MRRLPMRTPCSRQHRLLPAGTAFVALEFSVSTSVLVPPDGIHTCSCGVPSDTLVGGARDSPSSQPQLFSEYRISNMGSVYSRSSSSSDISGHTNILTWQLAIWACYNETMSIHYFLLTPLTSVSPISMTYHPTLSLLTHL